MDHETFRRLCMDALRGRLSEPARNEWDAHRRAHLECASYFEKIEAADRAITGRFESVRSSGGAAPQASQGNRSRANGRLLALLAPLAAIAGATLAAVVMFSVLARPDDGQPGPRSIVAKSNAPEDIGANTPSLNEADNSPATNGAAEFPSDNTSRANEPEPAPPDNGEPEPVKPPPVEPPPDRLPPSSITVLGRIGDPRVLIQRESRGSYREAVSEEEGGLPVIRPGDRVKLSGGGLVLRFDGLRVTATQRAEFELKAAAGRITLRMTRGRFAVRDRSNTSREFRSRQASWTLTAGAFVLYADLSSSDLDVIEGTGTLTRGSGVVQIHGATHYILGLRTMSRRLTYTEVAALDGEIRGARKVLMKWDFEQGAGVCERGKRITPGARGSKGALAWRRTETSAGTDRDSPLFEPTEGTRIRFRVRTNAAGIAVLMRAHESDGFIPIRLNVKVNAVNEWVLVDLPLSDARAGPWQDSPGLLPGRRYTALQFRFRHTPGLLPSERVLAIDDVEVYTPEYP